MPPVSRADDNGLEFICIFFDGDRLQLPLFAKGFHRFLNDTELGKIRLIYNGDAALSGDDRQSLVAFFGRHAPKVSIEAQSDYLETPRTPDWWTQQILKLKAAAASKAKNVVVLDTKNVFCKPVDRDFFVTPDGRALCCFNDFREHPMAAWLVASLRLFDLDIELVRRFPQTVTPFVMDPKEVLALIARLADQDLSLEAAFDDHRVGEFLLYSAHIASRYGTFAGHMVDRGFGPSYTIWPSGADPQDVAGVLADFDAHAEAIFSVHRDAMHRMSDPLRKFVTAFWVHRGLFEDLDAANAFVATFQRGLRR